MYSKITENGNSLLLVVQKTIARTLALLPNTAIHSTLFQKIIYGYLPKTPRSPDKWQLTYKRRTSVERSNKREKIDFHLEAGRHRSTKIWYIRIYCIMMCQHIDAWYSEQNQTLRLPELTFNQTA